MKQLMIRVLFDRKGQATAKKAALVQLEVRFNKQRKFIGTGIKVFKGQFKCGRVVGRADADILNDKINGLYTHVNNVYLECVRERKPFALSMLDLNSQLQEITFLDFIKKRTEEKRSAKASLKNNQLFCRLFESFGLIRTFNDITLPNIHIFDTWLKNYKGTMTGKPLKLNSIKVYHSILRMFISEAVSFGLVEQNPYSKFRQGHFQATPRVYLTMSELQKLRTFIPPTKARRVALDLFLIQCYTGLSYTDLMATDFTKREEHDGNIILPRTTRVKTGTQFHIMLLPPVLQILSRYDDIIPHVNYVAYSKQLALIEQETGIGKHITSHVGRHTFATTIALGSGIPIEVVSKMLGHTNIQTTQIYAKILPKQVVEGFSQIKQHVS